MGTVDEVPVIVCVGSDPQWRTRLATAVDGTAVLLFARDFATAQSLLDRHRQSGQRADRPVVRVGELEVDQLRCRARWRGTLLRLTRLERDLLAGLAAGPSPRVWTYQELYAAVWTGRYLDPGPVHAAVKRLRRKLRGAGVPVRVDAVRGVGYQLVDAAGAAPG